MDKPAPSINLNNNIPPKRVTLPPPNIKLFNIPQDILQEIESIIDDIVASFEEHNISFVDKANLDPIIENSNGDVHQDFEPALASVIKTLL